MLHGIDGTIKLKHDWRRVDGVIFSQGLSEMKETLAHFYLFLHKTLGNIIFLRSLIRLQK